MSPHRTPSRRTLLGAAGLASLTGAATAAPALAAPTTPAGVVPAKKPPLKGRATMLGVPYAQRDTVRIGMIGLGNRGGGMWSGWAAVPGARIDAVCDIRADRAARTADGIEAEGHDRPREFGGAEESFQEMLDEVELDLVEHLLEGLLRAAELARPVVALRLDPVGGAGGAVGADVADGVDACAGHRGPARPHASAAVAESDHADAHGVALRVGDAEHRRPPLQRRLLRGDDPGGGGRRGEGGSRGRGPGEGGQSGGSEEGASRGRAMRGHERSPCCGRERPTLVPRCAGRSRP